MLPTRSLHRPFAIALAGGFAIVAASCSSGSSILDSKTTTTLAAGAETTSTATGSTASGPTTPAATTTTQAPTTTASALSKYPPCPTDALAKASGTTELTFWHAMNSDLEKELVALTDRYNASQSKVKVTLVNQLGYEQNLDKYKTSSAGSRPNLVQLPEYTLKVIADSGTVVPVQACATAEGYALDKVLAKARDTYTTGGIQWSMPFNASDPVLFYDRKAFTAAGLDPAKPPATLEELRADCEAIVKAKAKTTCLAVDSGTDSGGGWFIEQWLAKAGQPYADNGNGRQAPATKVLYDSPTTIELMQFLQKMITDGLAVNVGENARGTDNLLKLVDPAQPAAMTINTSAALGPALNLLKAGSFKGFSPDDLGIGPLPGPATNPGALLGGASLWIVAGKGDAQTAASWDYIKFLVDAPQQSEWAAKTGYVPINTDAPGVDPIRATYATDPRFKVAFDQVTTENAGEGAKGPVLGPLREIRTVTAKAVQAILSGSDAATELAAAAQKANALIADYNASVKG